MDAKIFRINYKSDFILTMNSDAGWAIQFCIKFWTSVPSRAYFVGFDGTTYTHCAYDPSEPTKLVVQFDDHHLPIGDLNYQIAYHFTVADFPNDTEDEVLNQASVITEIDGEQYHVMLDFNGETAPEIEFSLPAYANEAQRIANEEQRVREFAQMQLENTQAVEGAENVNATLNGNILTVTNREGQSTSVNTKGEKGDKGDKGDTGTSIVSFEATGQTDVSVVYTVTFSDDTTQEVAVPKGPQGDTGLTGNGIASTTLNSDYTLTVNYTDGTSYTTPSIRGAQGVQGVSVIGFTQTGETETNTVYNLVFSDGRTQSVAIPKGAKGDKGDTGNTGAQGAQGPKGDTVTATDYTLYNVQGADSNGAMSQDATTKAISAQTGYYTCGTAAGTPEKVVTVENGNLYKRTLGGHFKVKMTNANTAASGATLKIGSETAPLYYNGEPVSADNSWDAGEVISVYYDGSVYQASNAQGGGGKAEKIKYDNSQSGLAADNVQEALDATNQELTELAGECVTVNDSVVVAQSLAIHEERIDEVEAGLTELRDNAITQDEMKVIATALNELKDNEGSGESSDVPVYEGGVSGSVTVLNSDTISAFGSSFGTGSYNIAGKNWIAKLSLFSDYRFENISYDGFNYYTLLYYTRIGAYVPTFHGKYALMACNENLDRSPIDVKIRALDNICTYFRVKGVIPIIASSYCYSQAESAALRNYANKHGYLFWDETKYASLVKSGISKLGNGGFHLGTRDSTMVSDLYEKGVMLMEKPRQSIKIFRLREGVSYENKDAILFRNNEERAVSFKELYIGTHCTNVPDGGGSLIRLTNEYNELINGHNVVFTTPALISCILPVDANDLTSLALSIRSSVNIRVFTQNRIDGTYPISQTYTRFSVNGLSVLPAAGTVYSNENTTYTVVSVTSGSATGYDYYIYCSPTTSGTIGSGTLTKVSGDGPSSISFDIGEASTLSVDNVVLTDTVGHWVEVPQISGKYRIAASDIVKCVDKDRIDFLITFDDASCQLSQISVDYTGAAIKQSTTRRYLDFESNYWSNADEIIPETTFGAVGSTSAIWKDDNNNFVSSVAAGVTFYPLGCSSCVKVNSENAINYTIPRESLSIGGEGILELWCRFFPDVYTDGSGNQITTESYDYRNICVQMNTAVLSEKVGLMWKVVQFPISIFANEELPLRIYSDSADGLEICKVSFKFKNS